MNNKTLHDIRKFAHNACKASKYNIKTDVYKRGGWVVVFFLRHDGKTIMSSFDTEIDDATTGFWSQERRIEDVIATSVKEIERKAEEAL